MPATHSAGGPGTVKASDPGFNTKKPVTRLGKWSMWLAAAFVVMFAINSVFVGVFGTATEPRMREFSSTYLPFYGVGMMFVGFVAGIVGLVAIVKQKERSLLTLLSVVPTLFVTMFVVGEFLFPH